MTYWLTNQLINRSIDELMNSSISQSIKQSVSSVQFSLALLDRRCTHSASLLVRIFGHHIHWHCSQTISSQSCCQATCSWVKYESINHSMNSPGYKECKILAGSDPWMNSLFPHEIVHGTFFHSHILSLAIVGNIAHSFY